MKPKALDRIVKILALALPLSACAVAPEVKCDPLAPFMSIDNETRIVLGDGSVLYHRIKEYCSLLQPKKVSYDQTLY